MPDFDRLARALEQRRAEHLYRTCRITESPQAPEMIIDGKAVISFCSNDYLGLANHPKIIEAFTQGAQRWGVGSGAAHLINGHSGAHAELEIALAEFTGCERALLFSTGYMANLGVASAFIGRHDRVFQDRWNHASLIDAGVMSRAKVQRYAHTDTDALAALLNAELNTDTQKQNWVLTDAVFSMDGDLAPLPALAQLCAKPHSWLVVDDAHGFGVLGPQGRGSCALFNLDQQQIPIVMGTLGKAFGTAGAFVAGRREIIETLIQQAHTYVYTTAMPAALACASLASLELVREEQWRRERLQQLIQLFHRLIDQAGLPRLASNTPIQPILVGDSARALRLSQALFEQNILVTAIRPPTVPVGTARLRITLSAAHTDAQLLRLCETLASVWQECPL
ncbi:MAG: 8-amino-7-oxononanoate synthase [Gammaproteobacteria bacterium]|nr:8-amino-7-oxononanoate synthase [Gammaproteobacteria bacterium]